MNQDYREYGLKTYEVVVEETRMITYRVQALSEDEAAESYSEGEQIDYSEVEQIESGYDGEEVVTVTEVV